MLIKPKYAVLKLIHADTTTTILLEPPSMGNYTEETLTLEREEIKGAFLHCVVLYWSPEGAQSQREILLRVQTRAEIL